MLCIEYGILLKILKMNYSNGKEQPVKKEKIITKLLLLWLLLSVYIIIHEGGHVLAALLFGGKITSFNINILNPGMSYSGNFSGLGYSIIHLSGFGLPFILWFIFISLIPGETDNLIIEYLKVYSAVIIFTIIPGIIIPILDLFGNAPQGDDITKFLNRSGFNSFAVSLVFLALFILSFYIWLKKTNNIKKILLSQDNCYQVNKDTFKPMIALSLVLMLLVLFPWSYNLKPEVGEDYQMLCKTPNLRELGGGEWELSKFWIEDNEEKVEILIIGKNIAAKIFDLRLEGSNNTIIPFAHSKEFTSGTIKYNKITTLEAGEYRFMMSAEEIKGHLYIYLKRD